MAASGTLTQTMFTFCSNSGFESTSHEDSHGCEPGLTRLHPRRSSYSLRSWLTREALMNAKTLMKAERGGSAILHTELDGLFA